MTTITKPYETARRMRERAVEVGIDPFVAGTTPVDDLAAVIRLAPQLRLVEDADLDSVPRIGVPLTPLQRMENSGMTADEIASVLTFARGSHVETDWPSADHFTPLDYYDGGDAA